MNVEKGELTPGLYLVAVPIGNARDITLRALDVLRNADLLAAEDTRSLRRLMEIHGIPLRDRSCLPYHDHNGDRMRPKLLAALAAGQSVAYASEAGTPMISDPGFDLARAARAEGIAVTTAPGVSAVVTALTLAGQPTDRFFFAGFLPNSGGARRKGLESLRDIEATLVFYESPKRLGAMLADAAAKLGAERPATVCRELTKRFEEAREGSLAELAAYYDEHPPKGEIVVLIGKGSSEKISETDIDESLNDALKTMSVRDAADAVSGMLGLKRRPVYQRAMALAKERGDG
ncbi:16S rRNA (cytidine(1402)-2'-O)-methyltransferase [Citreicella sp. C3M06]|uniref:16S rRNA (cytidine(1402)-2'-O)-methyltransferase n=1 Tax=Roseobacteraceae TaxID=2854170 RepID=UPI001C0A0FFE|nr:MULTISPECIES: 16S rRNA (cytidine(1402)-2'-O)-methyltransferase [Roseobacteraceae]MBU2963816.1 16S rRNA (cytidine(1402)-2'-O)-methyltransferase [Citreicella sp. C3M06]MDO6584896.1 16S rRNA (cytidine(1402)-2'-O)-methyltransferase [Salipiger sp. 1_MG-2023]